MQRPLLQAGGLTLRASRVPAGPILCHQRYASKYNPMAWVGEKIKSRFLQPRAPAKQDSKVVEEARKAAEKRNEVSVFETATPEEDVEEDADADAEADDSVAEAPKPQVRERGPDEPPFTPDRHTAKTEFFRISHRKLNDIGRQIAGKPIDYALLQMHFSEKRASSRIQNLLDTARETAVKENGFDPTKLVVAEAWVAKGERKRKRLEPRARGKTGLQVHPMSRLNVVLKEGRTLDEEKARSKAYRINKVVSAAITREDKPIRNPGAHWAW